LAERAGVRRSTGFRLHLDDSLRTGHRAPNLRLARSGGRIDTGRRVSLPAARLAADRAARGLFSHGLSSRSGQFSPQPKGSLGPNDPAGSGARLSRLLPRLVHKRFAVAVRKDCPVGTK
jgi:hypothetical protein